MIEPTATGKRLDRRLYMGDGCHRLALLGRSGIDVLEPEMYRVHVAPRLRPVDYTATLLQAGILDRRSDYWAFLALSYGDLVEAVRGRRHLDSHPPPDPDRLAELRDFVAADEALLGGALGRAQ